MIRKDPRRAECKSKFASMSGIFPNRKAILMRLSEFEKEVLLYCMDDYVSLWTTIRMQNRQIDTDEPVPDWMINNSLTTIRNLLQMDFIVAGHLVEGGFMVSGLPCEEIISSIKKEINRFEKTPLNYGFVFWFYATAKGKKLAEKILPEK